MQTTFSSLLPLAAVLCALCVPFSGCGTSTFSAAGDAGSSRDGEADALLDSLIVVTPDSTPNETGSSSGGHDAEAGCPSPTTLDCNGTCVDPTTPQHCGSCTNVCDAGAQATCTSGQCGNGCSAPKPTNCGGTCTDLQTDPNHCGTCTKLCPGVDGGVGAATCSAGQCGYSCAADGGTPLLCGSYCVDPTAPTSCGSCTMNCAGPATPGTGKATCSTDGGVPSGNAGDGGPCGIACNTGYHFCNAGGGTGDCLSDTDDPSTDPCVVNFNTGVFVSASAAASGTGTMAAPFQKIGDGIAAATSNKKRVYVCIGTYAEQLSVTGAADGLTVYGNLDGSGSYGTSGFSDHLTLRSVRRGSGRRASA